MKKFLLPILIVFSIFGLAKETKANVNTTVPFFDFISLPQHDATYNFDVTDEIIVKYSTDPYTYHIAYNSSSTTTTIATFNPSSNQIYIQVSDTVQQFFDGWPVVEEAGREDLVTYYLPYTYNFLFYTDWIDACSKYKATSVPLVNTQTSETCGTSGDDSVIYDNSSYSLRVISPRLDENYHADVQPSTTFKIKINYRVPLDKFSSTRLQYSECPQVDSAPEDCIVIGSGTITSIRNNLTPIDNNGNNMFIEDSIVLHQWTHIRVALDDADNGHVVIYAIPFSLYGQNDTSLPSANSATLLNGSVQDLGFWGNTVRYLFVPNPSVMSGLQATMTSHAPFAYYYLIKDKFSSISLSSTNTAIDLTIPYGSKSLDLKFLDFSDIRIASFVSGIRALLGFALYIMFALYLYSRALNLFKQKD